MPTVHELATEVCALPAQDRSFLADTLLRSLNPTDPSIEEAWADEAQRRWDEFASGQTRLIPGRQVFDELLGKLSQ